ncbi:hypothetical protein WAE61_01820 [Comamonadaceae bacterium PP-2]
MKKEGPAEYHKGFLVEGIPPGALEEAQAERAKVITSALKKGEKPPEDFDRTAWLIKAKRKRINQRAYEVQSSAIECKAMAEKAGWLAVTVRALAKSK